MPTSYPNLRVLDETPELLLGYIFEEVALICKRTGAHLLADSFYGEPTAGCIGPANDWAVVAGEHLTLWRQHRGTLIISTEALHWVYALRRVGESGVALLTDPWGPRPAVWRLDPRTAQLSKVRDFPDYQGREYTEQVDW